MAGLWKFLPCSACCLGCGFCAGRIPTQFSLGIRNIAALGSPPDAGAACLALNNDFVVNRYGFYLDNPFQPCLWNYHLGVTTISDVGCDSADRWLCLLIGFGSVFVTVARRPDGYANTLYFNKTIDSVVNCSEYNGEDIPRLTPTQCCSTSIATCLLTAL
jgi:hypothetical protein